MEVGKNGRAAGSGAATRTIEELRAGVVVSVQAPPGHPLDDAETIARLAQCAQWGGAVALRINGAPHVRAVRRCTDLPIIGLSKSAGPRRPLITVHHREAAELAEAGASMIAAEFVRESGTQHPDRIDELRRATGLPIMADVSTFAEAAAAWEAGADLVGSTLSGYTPDSPGAGGEPDLALVQAMSCAGIRAVAEGRVSSVGHVRAAFDSGAHCVVVGGAITDPVQITERFVAASRTLP